MHRMSRGLDQWQLNVHWLNSLNKITARGGDPESIQSQAILDACEMKKFFLQRKNGWFVLKKIFSEKESYILFFWFPFFSKGVF